MKWEWLRVGRRIEWTTGGLVLFAVLSFGLTSALSTHSLAVGILVGVFLGGSFSLTLLVPIYLLLARRRRREEAGMLVPRRELLTSAGRVRFYLLLLVLTLVSARLQATHGFSQYFGSVPAVYFWNLVLFGAVIAWQELSLRFRKQHPPSMDRSG